MLRSRFEVHSDKKTDSHIEYCPCCGAEIIEGVYTGVSNSYVCSFDCLAILDAEQDSLQAAETDS